MRLHTLYGDSVLQSIVCRHRKRSAAMQPRYRADRLVTVFFCRRTLQNNRAVQMLTALRRQIQPVLLRTRIQRLKHRLPDLLAGIRSELTVVNLTRRTSHYQNLSRFHLRRRNQLLCNGTRFLSDCFKIHFVSLLAKQQYLCKRRLTLFPRISLLSSAYIIIISERYSQFFPVRKFLLRCFRSVCLQLPLLQRRLRSLYLHLWRF